jgi:hypothetical protein
LPSKARNPVPARFSLFCSIDAIIFSCRFGFCNLQILAVS